MPSNYTIFKNIGSKCKSNIASISLYSISCQQENAELFVIAEYYDSRHMLVNYPLTRPVFGIDCDYYQTHYTTKYISKFLADVLGEEKKSYQTNFYLFNKGLLTDTAMSISEINF